MRPHSLTICQKRNLQKGVFRDFEGFLRGLQGFSGVLLQVAPFIFLARCPLGRKLQPFPVPCCKMYSELSEHVVSEKRLALHLDALSK